MKYVHYLNISNILSQKKNSLYGQWIKYVHDLDICNIMSNRPRKISYLRLYDVFPVVSFSKSDDPLLPFALFPCLLPLFKGFEELSPPSVEDCWSSVVVGYVVVVVAP